MSTRVSKVKGKEIEAEEVEDKIYVAVGNKVKENKSILVWSLQSSRGKRVCILLVHQPAQMIPTPIGYFPVDKVGPEEVKTFREKERKEMSKVLDEYAEFCLKAGMHIDKLYIEANSIEKGIIQLIYQNRIGTLVMGAAADKHYSRKMTELKSKKAIYVRENAPPYCHIWFVCKGYLIHTRATVKSPSPNTGENGIVNAEGNEGENSSAPPFNEVYDWSSHFSLDTDHSSLASRTVSERESTTSWFEPGSQSASSRYQSLAHCSESGMVPESLYLEECRIRREVEAELANAKEELLYMKNHLLREIRSAMEQKSLLDSQIGNSTFLLKMLGEKLASTIKLVHDFGEQ